MFVPNTAFYAYASGSQHRTDTIETAIKSINERSKVNITSWRRINAGGKIIIQTILSRIRKSDIFICDLTGLNSNVLFELGYAVGLQKRVWLTLDVTKKTSQPFVNSLDVVSNFGYRMYTNHEDIIEQFLSDFSSPDLDNHILSEYDSWMDQIMTSSTSTDIFYIPSSVEDTAAKN